jgi:Ion channel
LLLVLLLNSALVAVTVTIHYETFRVLSQISSKINLKHRLKIVLGVLGALAAHVIEIWVFAFGYYALNQMESMGSLEGNFDGSLLDCVYFSFTTFTTLGFGDIEPTGSLRYLTGIESLTGLVLITWTASFLYYEMQRHWES